MAGAESGDRLGVLDVVQKGFSAQTAQRGVERSFRGFWKGFVGEIGGL